MPIRAQLAARRHAFGPVRHVGAPGDSGLGAGTARAGAAEPGIHPRADILPQAPSTLDTGHRPTEKQPRTKHRQRSNGCCWRREKVQIMLFGDEKIRYKCRELLTDFLSQFHFVPRTVGRSNFSCIKFGERPLSAIVRPPPRLLTEQS